MAEFFEHDNKFHIKFVEFLDHVIHPHIEVRLVAESCI